MCGIVGVYGRAGEAASRPMLLAMAGELRHRGPDGVGLYLDGQFGMANTRLGGAPAGVAPPLSSGSGRYWVVLDGTIYNRAELRVALEHRGHRFVTRSDAELLAHAYEAWGASALERLNGEFALALWDHEAGELFLARDRFGVRPLFFAEWGGDFCFASEGKALLRHPAAVRALDALGLVEAFTLWATLPERSAFVGVRELPGGHWLRLGVGGGAEVRRWWDLPLAEPGAERAGGEGELAEQLLELLEDAVRIRLRGEEMVGLYLSGGVDSSAVAALARRATGVGGCAFAIGFDDPRFDETPYQELVAGAIGATLNRVSVGAAEIAAQLPRVAVLTEKPTLRTAPAPLLQLSAVARAAGCRAVLTGEGADELFAGYDIFKLDKVRRFWARQPDSRRRPLLLHRLFGYLPHDLHRTGALLAATFSRGLTDTADPLYSHRPRFERGGQLLRFFTPAVLERAGREGAAMERVLARLPEGFGRLSPLKRAQYLEVSTFLSGYLLPSQGDRMVMGNSVEGRFPFLDYRVAEFAARLPDRFLLRGLEEKYLLRKSVAPLLPQEITRREKRPYRAPILGALLGPDAPDYVAELTRPTRLVEAGIFAAGMVERLFEKCRRNVHGIVGEAEEMALVGIISVMLLDEQFIARPRLADPAVPTRVVMGGTALDPVREEPATTVVA